MGVAVVTLALTVRRDSKADGERLRVQATETRSVTDKLDYISDMSRETRDTVRDMSRQLTDHSKQLARIEEQVKDHDRRLGDIERRLGGQQGRA